MNVTSNALHGRYEQPELMMGEDPSRETCTSKQSFQVVDWK